MPSFEARQKEYSVNSQKHFYFMTLSANEVIFCPAFAMTSLLCDTTDLSSTTRLLVNNLIC